MTAAAFSCAALLKGCAVAILILLCLFAAIFLGSLLYFAAKAEADPDFWKKCAQDMIAREKPEHKDEQQQTEDR